MKLTVTAFQTLDGVAADGAVPAALRLLESRTTSTGIAIAVYAFAGTPSYGSFALEDQAGAPAD
ncbi:MAG TPA: hypothetical protein VGW75_13985 [Solirubrobacteraceae bacterium]|nr:hypothetical protein [Solirubrobacteraceae bacterium]